MLPVTDLLMLLMLTASFRRACVRACLVLLMTCGSRQCRSDCKEVGRMTEL